MSQITVQVAIKNHEPVFMVIPAESVISTALVVSENNASLPTLTSVERIVGRVSTLGISLAEPTAKLAKLVNAHYLLVDPTNWVDTKVCVQGELPGSSPDTESFRAVQAIRPPILEAADTILRTNPQSGGPHRREQEAQFLDSLTTVIRRERSVWESWPARVARYVATTALAPLVTALIGVPLLDVAGHALAGLNRII
jgi:hypothetical protein